MKEITIGAEQRIMNDKLYEWLRKEFYRSNHAKYRHLFEEWVRNITTPQIEGFNKQMYNKENNVLGLW